jgi:hypothetical protein
MHDYSRLVEIKNLLIMNQQVLARLCIEVTIAFAKASAIKGGPERIPCLPAGREPLYVPLQAGLPNHSKGMEFYCKLNLTSLLSY